MSAEPMKNLEGKETKHAPTKAAPPSPNSRRLLQREPKPQLPQGWLAYWSDEHQTYYYWSRDTDTVQWEKPGMPSTPAPYYPPRPSNGQDLPSPSPAPSPPPPPAGGTHAGHLSHHETQGPIPIVEVYLFEFSDDAWKHCQHTAPPLPCLKASARDQELLGRYEIKETEQAILMEFDLKDDSKDQYLIVISHHPDPLAIAMAMHSLGFTGTFQVSAALSLDVCVYVFMCA